MTNLQPVIGSGGGDVQAAIDAGSVASEPFGIGGSDRFFSVTVPSGATQKTIDIEQLAEAYRDVPRRKTGVHVAHDADSFVALVAKHGLAQTEIYADATKSTVTAVINAHHGVQDAIYEDRAGWGDHRIQLALQITPEWQAWTRFDRTMIGQVDFAEHIEDRLIDILDPPSADMLEVAQSLSVKRDVSFESSNRLATGERRLSYRENDNATAGAGGKRGELAIPEQFVIGLRPYEGGEAYQIPARLRYRISDGGLLLGYVLDRPSEVLRNAFLDIRATIEALSERKIFAGTYGTR